MGGSAIGGDLARGALGSRTTLPFTTVRDYGLEPWTSPERTVLCASYSGNTEETLAAFEAAAAVGARRVVATTGGALGDAAREADVPIIPDPRGASAPSGRRLHVRRCGRGCRRWPAPPPSSAPRSTARSTHLRAQPRRAHRARRRDRRRDRRLVPRDLRRRPHDVGRLPLEDPDQRERQDPRLLPLAARDGPQRARRLGRGRRRASSSRRSSSTTRTSIRAPASASS